MKRSDVLNHKVEELSRRLDPFAIKNFIVTDVKKKVPDNMLDYPHTLDGIAFSICIKGSARVKINMQEILFCPNMALTILPNAIIEPIEISKDFSMEVLLFSPDFIVDLPLQPDINIFDVIEQTPHLYVSEEEYQNLLKFHAFIAEQYNRKDHCFRIEIAKGLLYTLIAEIGSLYSQNNLANVLTLTERRAGQFLALLRKHYRTERNIAFYAEKMCLTPKYLTSTLKKITGKSILVWIHEAMIAYAKAQLKSSNKTVAQIAEDLQFTDTSLFCRFFKKHTGMTPLQYRDTGMGTKTIIPI